MILVRKAVLMLVRTHEHQQPTDMDQLAAEYANTFPDRLQLLEDG